MLRHILTIVVLLLIPYNAFAYNGMVHSASEGLTGTGGDSVDEFSCINSDTFGHNLATGDVMIGTDPTNGFAYFYIYDGSDSTSAEDPPLVIVPNDIVANCSNTGRWILVQQVRKEKTCFTVENPVDADDNVPVFTPLYAITVTDLYCRVQGGTSIDITLSDGTNALDTVTCTTSGASDDGSIANATFIPDERIEFDSSSLVGSVTWVNYCFWYVETP